MRLLFVPIFTILLHITAGAQTNQPNPAEIGVDPMVEIVTDYQGKILETDKLDISYFNNIPFLTKSTFSYQVLPLTFSSDFNMKPIPPAGMQIYDEEKEQGIGYFRGGLGYPLTPDFNLYLRGELREQSSVNLYVNHRSFWGKVPMYKDAPHTADPFPSSNILGNHAKTRAGVTLQYFWKNTALDARVEYRNTYLIYYGQDTLLLQQANGNYINHITNDKYMKDNLSQMLQHIQTEVKFYSIAGNNGRTNFNISGLYEYIDEKAHTYYNQPTAQQVLGLDLQLNQKTSKKNALDFRLNTRARNDYGKNSLSNVITNFIPTYQFRSERASLTAGVNVEGVYNHEKFTANIYPHINFSYAVIDTYLTPYLSADGGTKMNNYAKITGENPYILPGLDVANSRHAFNLNLGVKGSINNYLAYQFNAGYTMIDSMYFYTNSTIPLLQDGISANKGLLRSNFDVYYDNIHKLTFELGLNVKVASFEALLKAGYFQYSMNSTDAKPWHLPNIEAGIDLKYTMDQWIFNINGLFRGETPVLLNSSYPALSTVTPAYVNLGAMVEYRLDEQVSVYIQGTNLLNNNYQQYYLYYRPGITLGAGISIVF